MRFWLLALLFVSCAPPPCTSGTSEAPSTIGNLTCVCEVGGAVVRYGAYSTLTVGFADACTGIFDGGALSFAVTTRDCEPGAATGSSRATCSLPSLPAGRYAIGSDALVVPADGGVTTCE